MEAARRPSIDIFAPAGYIPRMLSRIIAQAHVKELLAAAIERERLAHAYLILGHDGWGAEELAIEFSRYLLCKSPGRLEPCGQCSSCKKVASFQHADFHYYFPILKSTEESDVRGLLDAKSEELYTPAQVAGGSIHIGDPDDPEKMSVRGLARDVQLRSYEGSRKVFVLAHADRMNDEAANALLKILEEPPPHAFFLLTTSRPQRILPTIVSRCQVVKLSRPRESDLAEALQKRQGLNADQAMKWARLSDGSYYRALQLQSGDFQERREMMLGFLRTTLGSTPSSIGMHVDQMLGAVKRDKTQVQILLDILSGWFEDVLMIQHGQNDLLNDDIRERVVKFSEHFPSADCEGAIYCIEEAAEFLSRNVYLPLVLVDLGIALRRCVMRRAA